MSLVSDVCRYVQLVQARSTSQMRSQEFASSVSRFGCLCGIKLGDRHSRTTSGFPPGEKESKAKLTANACEAGLYKHSVFQIVPDPTRRS